MLLLGWCIAVCLCSGVHHVHTYPPLTHTPSTRTHTLHTHTHTLFVHPPQLLQQVLPPEVRHGRKVVVHAAGPHDDGYDEDVATWHVCAVDEAAAQQRFTDMVQVC